MKEKNAELQAIRDTIDLYIKGLDTGNIDTLKKAFHPQAMMFGSSEKTTTIVAIQGLYDYVAANNPPVKTGEPHECFVSSIQYAGNVASVEMTEAAAYGNDYTNYFQLLKIDGKWVIVSKAYNGAPSNAK